MSRFGKLPVLIPEKVLVNIQGQEVSVTGPKGSLKRIFPRVKIAVQDNKVFVEQEGHSKQSRAAQGSTRAHIANMIQGVSEGWKKQLEISGPGYRAEVRGKDLVLSVGYSHPVVIKIPDSIQVSVEKNLVTISGVDKEEVGHISALVRDARRPNPYTGSGVRYADEKVRRKAGKQAGKTE